MADVAEHLSATELELQDERNTVEKSKQGDQPDCAHFGFALESHTDPGKDAQVSQSTEQTIDEGSDACDYDVLKFFKKVQPEQREPATSVGQPTPAPTADPSPIEDDWVVLAASVNACEHGSAVAPESQGALHGSSVRVKALPRLGLGLHLGAVYTTANLVQRCGADFSKIQRLDQMLTDPTCGFFEPVDSSLRNPGANATELKEDLGPRCIDGDGRKLVPGTPVTLCSASFCVKEHPELGLGLHLGSVYTTENLVQRCKGNFSKIRILEQMLKDPSRKFFEPVEEHVCECADDPMAKLGTDESDATVMTSRLTEPLLSTSFRIKEYLGLGLGLRLNSEHTAKDLIQQCKGDSSKIHRLELLLVDPSCRFLEPVHKALCHPADTP